MSDLSDSVLCDLARKSDCQTVKSHSEAESKGSLKDITLIFADNTLMPTLAIKAANNPNHCHLLFSPIVPAR
jgi:hypothetical protein